MPAPHALLRPLRPASLPSEIARVVGVYSGTVLDTVGFFANIIHPLDSLPSFGFRVIQIRHRQPFDQSLPTSAVLATRGDGIEREEASGAKTSGFDPESGEQPAQPSLVRRQTVRQRASTLVSNGLIVINPMVRPAVRTSSLSPLNILSFISFLMTLGLIAAAVVWNDGTALTAICLISLASSVICYAAFWQPIILTRRSSDVPRGDVVIRTREGGFILVRCTKNIARELYSGIQECSYHVSGIKYRLLMILGATMIMPSVVLMGNCTFNMQLLIGSCYMMLNVAYWSLGTLPLYRFWDLSSYEWQDVTPEDSRNAERFDHTGGYSQFDSSPSFTRTLWYAIRETQRLAGFLAAEPPQ